MEPLTLQIEGMGCGHCVARVEKTLAKLPGVAVRKVNLGSAEVMYDPGRTPFERIRQALDEEGYTARPVEAAGRIA